MVTPNRSRRKDSWKKLSNLAEMSSLSWCIIGDFNDINSVEDKCGRVPHPN